MATGENLRLWLIAECIVFALSVEVIPFGTSYEEIPLGKRCLGSCLCYEASKTVNCSGKDYDYIPYNIPSNTLVLDLSHNTISNISPDNLQDIHNVTSLDMSYNQITILRELSFNAMGNLKVMKLTNNAAAFVIRRDTFASLYNLEELYFGFTAAQGLFDGVFTSQNKLTVLNIDNSNVFPSSFKNATFEGLINLRELSIAGSYLYDVPMDVMQPFRNTLQKLSMRFSSRLSGIGTDGNQKPDFPNLEELDFSYSQIQYLAPEGFSGVPKLKSLDLSGNFLLALPPRAFVGLSSLQVLDISLNSLVQFPSIALEPVSETLLNLRMSRVYFTDIRDNASAILSDTYLSRLESLRIERGNLGSIAEDSFFKNLRSLKYLSLANNQFGSLPTVALSRLESLETADFSGNPITRVTGNDIPRLPTLRHLLLSDADIATIDDEAFSLVTLESLKLDDNKLNNLSESVLSQQTNLTYLDISSNLLQTANKHWFSGKPLEKISLSGNPWNCDCEMTDFYNWMTTAEYLEIQQIDPVICDTPRNVKGYPLPLVRESDLTCEIGQCPTSCMCNEISTVERFSPSSQDIIAASEQATLRRVEKSDEVKTTYVSPLDFIKRGIKTESKVVASFQTDCTGSELTDIPKVPNTTEYMNIAQNLITQINTGDITYLRQLKTFIASDNKITSVEDGCFSGLDIIEIIYLNKNLMTQAVDLSWLSNLTSLQELRLDDNMISEISPSAFSDLGNLDFLDLSRNSITSVPSDIFTGLHNLTFLNLAANRISSIHESTFQGLTKLRYLYLNGNYLSTIPSIMIRMNPNLEFLDLSENSFSTISDNFLESESLTLLKMEYGYNPTLKNGSFRGLPNLEVLRLEGGNIANVEAEAWLVNGESKLHTLDMAYNSITEIPLVAFESLVNLESLGLSGNQISSIPKWKSNAPFLPKLTTLFLAKNPGITIIPADSAISTIKTLKALVMNECSLNKVPVDALLTTQVQYLVLDENPITQLNDDFSQLTQMRELQFGGALTLATLSEGAFHNLSNLERLVISDSKLSEIPANTFSNLKNLEVVDISNNKLTQPYAEWFTDLDANKVKSVLLYGNPWECNCNAAEYKTWLDSGSNGLNEQFLSVTCTSPQQYKGWSMTEINYSEDVCSTDSNFTTSAVVVTTATTQDPNCAKCVFIESTKTGNCSDGMLTYIPRGCFPADVEKLDLSRNRIREIQSDDFANLKALFMLDLKGNRIELIFDDAFRDLPKLSDLDLSSNRLSEIPSTALSHLDASLLVLNLDYQSINSLPAESLPLTNLIELSMRAIGDGAILQRLAIEDFAFAKLSSLTKLDLSYNKVSALDKDSLTGLHELQYLNMAATNLSSFPYETFWRVPKLTELVMDNNAIQILGYSTVPLLESLQKLSIKNNNLKTITNDCFLNSCQEIQELDFGVNSFNNVPTNLLMTYKPRLEILRLDHSLIPTVYRGDFPTTTKGVVDLSNSIIHTIGAGTFRDMDELSQLHLNNNSITRIADDAFTNSGLQYLDLSYNELEYISCAWIDGLRNDNQATVELSGNRFNCTCAMAGYRHYISSAQSNVTVVGDICTSPEELSGVKVENVNLEDMQISCNNDDVSPTYCDIQPTSTPATLAQTTSGTSGLHSEPCIFVWAIILALKIN